MLAGGGGGSEVRAGAGAGAGRGETSGLGRIVARVAARIWELAMQGRAERRLRVCEMLSLGEKRFVAVVAYGPRRFLLGSTPGGISLLETLDEKTEEAGAVARRDSSGG